MLQIRNSNNADVRDELRVCSSLLDFFTTFRLGLRPLAEDEKVEWLEVIAVQLYPNGPEQEHLWDRAGGHDADLSYQGSGRSRWHDALKKARFGRGPSLAKLTLSMLSDYPDNEELRFLVQLVGFGARS